MKFAETELLQCFEYVDELIQRESITNNNNNIHVKYVKMSVCKTAEAFWITKKKLVQINEKMKVYTDEMSIEQFNVLSYKFIL